MTVVLCKWQPELARRVADRSPFVLVLDAFDLATYELDHDVVVRAARTYAIDSFDSLEQLVNVAADLTSAGLRPDEVLSFTEYSQLGAAVLRSLLGIELETATAVAARDKRLMKERAGAAGVRVARWWSLPDPGNATQVRELAEQLPFPVVLKPASGSGTEDTARADDAEELVAVAARLGRGAGEVPRQAIVEEFVKGVELHVDALWRDGEPVYFTVAEYFKPRIALAPGDESTGDGSVLLREDENRQLYQRLMEMSRRSNTAFGVTTSATHLEVFRTPDDELVFSEIATRVGGGWIPMLLTAHLGSCVWHVVADGFTGASVASTGAAGHLAAMHLRPVAPGRITRLPDAEELRAEPGVVDYRAFREPGDLLAMGSPSEWCAFVILRASTCSELTARIEQISTRYRVETEPVVEPVERTGTAS